MKTCAAILASSLVVCLAQCPAALADAEAKINARIAAGGTACKNAVAVRYPKSTMADISVELGATLQQSIDAGNITLKDIKQSGLSYNWSYRKHNGYCNTDGSSNVVEFKKF